MNSTCATWQEQVPAPKQDAVAKALASRRTPGSAWDASRDTPRLREFHKQFAGGGGASDPLFSAEGLFLYGKARLNEALHQMKTPRFAESLRQVPSC